MTTNPSPVSFPDFNPTPERSAYYDPQRQAWQVPKYNASSPTTPPSHRSVGDWTREVD